MTTSRLAFLCAVASCAVLAETAAPLLVDVNWLSSHLNDRDLVLLHVGPKADYESGHIAGARYISLEDVAKPMQHKDPMEIMLELPTPEILRAKLETFGVSDNSRVVVYFGAKGALQSATRVVFTLDYLGLGDHVSLLNGGMPAWTTAGKPLTQAAPPAATTGKLTPRATKNVVADADVVKSVSQHPNQKLIDARAPVYYKGTEATYEKNGHIPGAANIPFSELLDTALMLDRDRVEKLFKSAGVNAGDTVVAYCHIGQQATAVIFAARVLGHPVMLYDGSFQDWAINSRGPVEK
jgi:thiosulfate/3-mercaptopyruvate sulfurtransferase